MRIQRLITCSLLLAAVSAAQLFAAQQSTTSTSATTAPAQTQSPASTQQAAARKWPAPQESDFRISEFKFQSGESLRDLRIHYKTFGKLKRDAKGVPTNVILLLHSTSGSGDQFMNDRFAAQAFNPGQPFDAEKWFIVVPDSIGHGKSSKPSDGLRGKFPKYNYDDMVRAQHQLLTEGLQIQRVKLVIGMSMGCMHAWVWAEKYPDIMDGLMPLACLPIEIAGRNRMWRKLTYDAIVKSPDYNGGDYTKQPSGHATALGMLQLMGSNPVLRQKQWPTRQQVDTALDRATDVNRQGVIDANDLAWAIDSSNGYDPQPNLGKIKAKVLAINFADDLINPPELGILETEIKKVPTGRAVTIPPSDQTVGHGTHTSLLVYKSYLEEFMRELER